MEWFKMKLFHLMFQSCVIYCSFVHDKQFPSTDHTNTHFNALNLSLFEMVTTTGNATTSECLAIEDNKNLSRELTEKVISNCNDTYQRTTFENSTISMTSIKSTKTKQGPLEAVYHTLLYTQDMYVIPFICTVGITGNCLVARNLFMRRKVNSSFIYMVFILLADILSLVSDLFLPISRVLQLSDSVAVRASAVYMYFWNADVISFLFRRFSLNIFCVLSYERLMAITKPLKLYKSLTVTHSYVFIIISFIVSTLATVVTPLFTKMTSMYDVVSNSTKYVHSHTVLYSNYNEYLGNVMIVARFLDGPLQILFFTVVNARIIYSLYKNKHSSALQNTDRTKKISKLQTRLCKIFLVLSFTNMLAFLPNAIIVIVAKLFPETGLSIRSYTMKIFMFGGNILRVINSITDFIVFVVMSKDIREDIKAKICCCKAERKLAYIFNSNSLNTVMTVEENCSSIDKTD